MSESTTQTGPQVLTLTRGAHRLDLLPTLGGAIAGWASGDRALLQPVADPNLIAQEHHPVAAYPLVPYSNRIADAHFTFEGETFALSPNILGESNSIHGNAWEREWTVAHQSEDRAVLILDHRPENTLDGTDPAMQWPFTYRAALSYALVENGLDVELVVENRDTRPQPVGFGFHPFFPRSEDTRVSFDARGVWLSDASNLPQKHATATGEWGFSGPTDVSARAIDNCFSGWSGHARVDWTDSGLSMTIKADPVFHHLVVFTAPGKPFVAMEPVSNMNDAIHHPEIPDRGLHVLKPAGLLQGKIRFRLVDADG
jgi:aldose 1-epimerase